MPCQKCDLFNHEECNDNLFCDGIAVRPLSLFQWAHFVRKCAALLQSVVFFRQTTKFLRKTTTDNIHSNNYEETLAKHFTQRLQLVT